MAWRVSMHEDRSHAGKYFLFLRKGPGLVVVRGNLLPRALEIHFLGPFTGAAHGAIVMPMLWFVFVHHQLGIRKEFPAGFRIGQTGGVIRMHMRQDDRVDVSAIDTSGFQVLV